MRVSAPVPRTRRAVALAVAAVVAAALPAVAAAAAYVRVETDAGTILLAMRPDIAPHHVANFTTLASRGFYDGTYFHRVIPGFMIQGGDPNTRNADRNDDGTGGPTWSDVLTKEELAIVDAARPFRNATKSTPDGQAKVAAADKLLAAKGYVWQRAESISLQGEFSKTEKHLRGVLSMARTSDPAGAGSQFFLMVAPYPSLDGQYSIFGSVVTGMEAADKIVGSQRDARDNPLQSIKIRKMTVIKGEAELTATEKAAVAKAKAPAPAPKAGG